MAPKEDVECVVESGGPFPLVEELTSVAVEGFLTGHGSAKTPSEESEILGNSPPSILCASSLSTPPSGDSVAPVLGIGDDHSGQSQDRAFLNAEGPSSCMAFDDGELDADVGGGLLAPDWNVILVS